MYMTGVMSEALIMRKEILTSNTKLLASVSYPSRESAFARVSFLNEEITSPAFPTLE